MKKVILSVISGVIISGLSTSVALAQEHSTKLTAVCPGIGSNANSDIVNYGNFLAGTGTLRVNSDAPSQPLFQGPIVQGAKIPTNFAASGYSNNGVSYNPNNGALTCYYKSSNGFDPFSVSFLSSNSLGGTTTSSDSSEIHVKLPVGH